MARTGPVYVGYRAGTLYAVSPAGRLDWSFYAGGVISSAAAVAEDDTVCFGCEDNWFYCLNPDGTLCRRLRLDVPVRNSPAAIAHDGTIYFHADGWLYALHGDAPLVAGQWPKFQCDARNTGRAGQ